MSSPIYKAGSNWSAEVNRLRKAGVNMPNSPTMARAQAVALQNTVDNKPLIDYFQGRRRAAEANRQRLASYRKQGNFGSNMQIAMPKIRQPLGTLADKGIPFNVEDEEELKTIRHWCNTPEAPVWMADYTFKAIGDITPGEQVIGWTTDETRFGSGRRQLVPSTVLAVNRRMAPEVVRITFESGTSVTCTPDHEWLRYYIPGANGKCYGGKRAESDYAPLEVGSIARRVITPTKPLSDPKQIEAAFYLAGIIDGEGSWKDRSITIAQSEVKNPAVCARIEQSLNVLGLEYVKARSSSSDGRFGSDVTTWTLRSKSSKTRQSIVDLYNWTRPEKMTQERMDAALLSKNFGDPERVVSVESLGPGEVVSMQTTTGNYTAWGVASKNCRLFYATHDLVPLLIDIYSKFPVVGMEFDSKDPLIKTFYEDLFFGEDLNYLEFLPDQFAREYFTVGEVTSLAHFNESLGVWSSEEILNPDMLRVSRSMFVQRERVQLMVKDLVDHLRQGPTTAGGNMSTVEETPSEREQRMREFQDLQRRYPEIIQAAMQNDGLDISEALISRVVNRPTAWATRGAPHLLRSFRTLMAEESLNAAQDAVADRLYSPLVLATLGIEDMGDGEPWIPDQGELDEVRDDMQSLLAADFRLMVHNFGLKVENVFGRESVPNLDADYDRIERKLLQAWGIGEALISGGTGGAYASSALNREFVTQIMTGFQNALKRHIRRRCEVVAEAQGHYDYDLKGGVRVPIYREIVEYDEETGQEYIRKVPKLLIPEVKFSTLNLRDEAQERAFIAQLKGMGVPVSDKTLAVNIDMKFDQELERQADETVQKLMATAQAMKKVQDLCDAQNLPYPPELAQHLQSTLALRQGKTQTELGEAQAVAGEAQAELQTKQIEMQEMMMDQQMAGGVMPGQPMLPPGAAGPPPGAPGDPAAGGPPPPAGGPMGGPPVAPAPGVAGPGNAPASFYAASLRTADAINGPTGTGPSADGPLGPTGPELPPGVPEPTEVPRNRQRPAESDDNHPGGNLKPASRNRKRTRKGQEEPRRLTRWEKGPSSYGKSKMASEEHVVAQIRRREVVANWDWSQFGNAPRVADLVADPHFYQATNMQAYQGQLQADWPEIQAGGAEESRRILDDMLSQFQEIFGVEPQW
ncbi:portal protein [Mycobacterium phage Pier]|nr:portal protein [Mycobacterium phage Pier]